MSQISKCQAYLKSNQVKQCSNKALPGEIYCGIHLKVYGSSDQLKTELQKESKIQETKELKNLRKIEKELGLDYLDPDSINILYGYLSLEELLNITKDNKYPRDKLIKTLGYKLPTLDNASKNGDLETVKYLIEIGKKPTQKILYGASRYGHLDIVEYLVLEQHIQPMSEDIGIANIHGYTDVANFLQLHLRKPTVIRI